MRGLCSVAALAATLLAGCGFRVPEIPETGGRIEQNDFVQAILTNITCELRSALHEVQLGYPEGTFIDSWGAQITLTLTNDEKIGLAPSVLYSPLTPLNPRFSLGAGLNLSSEATRKDIINGYYLVADLEKAQCPEGVRPNGLFLLQSDLKLSEWLYSAVTASVTRTINFDKSPIVKENVIQHGIKFEIVTNLSTTPTFKLTEVTANPGSDFFTAGRTRTHDLLITFSPAVKEAVNAIGGNGRKIKTVFAQPIRQGADIHFSTLISNSIETGIRSAFQR